MTKEIQNLDVNELADSIKSNLLATHPKKLQIHTVWVFNEEPHQPLG